MRSPFPGMDPYLEHPSLWPDVHNSLISALRDDLAGRIAPRYYIRLEEHAYLVSFDSLDLPGLSKVVGRPDLSFIAERDSGAAYRASEPPSGVIEIEIPMVEEVRDAYMEVREVITGKIVTVVELLSPGNKLHAKGREEYELKRAQIVGSRTNLVEIDLLRAGRPMPTGGRRVESDYRILISRVKTRPRAHLYPFNLRDAILMFPLPLLPGDEEPPVDLGAILHALHERARYDLSLDYKQPPVPPIRDDDAAWAQQLISAKPT
jgi:hypothetical protein